MILLFFYFDPAILSCFFFTRPVLKTLPVCLEMPYNNSKHRTTCLYSYNYMLVALVSHQYGLHNEAIKKGQRIKNFRILTFLNAYNKQIL